MGHLAVRPCHKIEFAADLFAFSILSNINYKISPYFLFGALIELLLIDLIEKRRNISKSKTHPPAKIRIQSLLATFTENDRSIMQKFTDAVVAVCNPTLARYWNISLDI